jgi:Protein of unknown function (DUF2905)
VTPARPPRLGGAVVPGGSYRAARPRVGVRIPSAHWACIGHAGDVSRNIGPWLVGFGVMIAVIGALAWAGWLSWFGRLPGDIRITSGNTRVFIPITSMLITSVVLSIVLTLLRRR